MSEPVFVERDVAVHHGAALGVLATMADESISAVITDPPYGLGNHSPAAVTTALTAWVNADREHVPDGRGFMSAAWDSFVPPPAVWDECLRVLKPGGHLACFAGSRTVDLMTLSVRMAGFEIRDTIAAWVYSSGMVKSLDIGKAIDKSRDDSAARQAFGGWLREQRVAAGLTAKTAAAHFPSATGGITGCVANWELGLNLPTAEQWQTLRQVIGFSCDMDEEYARLVALKNTWGNERADRVTDDRDSGSVYQPVQHVRSRGTAVLDAARQWEGFGTALAPAYEPIILARKPLSGTVAATVLEHGTGGLNIAATRTGNDTSRGDRYRGRPPGGNDSDHCHRKPTDHAWDVPAGRWPKNVVLAHHPSCSDAECAADCQVRALDEQTGTLTTGGGDRRSAKEAGIYGRYAGDESPRSFDVNSGGRSRFFPTFRYEAKAPASERPQVDGVAHPTVKPLALIGWLIRLLTPPGGIVLDPFAGSGTTGLAAAMHNRPAVLIEREPSEPGAPDYIALIRARLQRKPRTAAPTADATSDAGLGGLFAHLDEESA